MAWSESEATDETDKADEAAARAAEEAFAAIDETDQARELLLRLVGLSPDGTVSRRWLRLADLVDAGPTDSPGRTLGRLLAAGILVVEDDGVQLADGLSHSWPRLRDWLTEPAPALAAEPQAEQIIDPNRPVLDRPAPDRRARPGRRSLVRRRAMVLGACLLIVAGAIVGVVSLTGGYGTTPSTAAGRANTLAADAEAARPSDPGVSAQLAIAAYRTSPTEDAANELYKTLQSPLDSNLGTMSKSVLRVTAASTGPLAAAVDQSGLTRIWNLADPAKPVVDATIHTAATAIALAPRGGLLAAACGAHKGMCLWNLTDPRRPTVLSRLPAPSSVPAATGGVTSVAFSPDGTMLAAATEIGQVAVWSVARPSTPQLLAILQDPTTQSPALAAVAFGTGGLLANTIIGGTTELWRVAGPTPPTKLATISSGYQSIAVSPNGKVLAAVSDLDAGLWNITDPTSPVATTVNADDVTDTTEDLRGVAFSPDGSRLGIVSADTGDTNGLVCTVPLSQVDAMDNSVTPTCAATGFGTSADVYLPSGALFTGGFDNTIRLWQWPMPEVDGMFAADVQSWSFDPESHLFIAPVNPSGEQPSAAVGLWAIPSAGPAARDSALPLFNAQSVGLLPNHVGLTVDGNGAVQLWDLADPHNPVKAASLGTAQWANHWPVAASVNVSGDLVSVLATDGRLHLWRAQDAQHATEIGTIRPPATVTGPGGIMPDGHTAFFISPAGIDWWDVSNPARPKAGGVSLFAEPQLVSIDGTGGLFAVSTSPAGTSHVAQLQLFSVSNGRPRTSTTVADAVGEHFRLDDGGQLLASTGVGANTVSLWDIRDPSQTHLLGTVTTLPSVEGIALDQAHGRMADWNGSTVELWDIHDPAAPTRLATITPGGFTSTGVTNDVIFSANFSSSGDALVVDTDNDGAQLLDADPTALATRLCTLAGHAITQAQWQRYAPGEPYDPPCPQ